MELQKQYVEEKMSLPHAEEQMAFQQAEEVKEKTQSIPFAKDFQTLLPAEDFNPKQTNKEKEIQLPSDNEIQLKNVWYK